jgi:predicted metal-dependent phosphoesterase TrpH
MRIDLHTHTRPLSRCSDLDLDQLVQKAKDSKLDGICLTEHNRLWDSDPVDRIREKQGFLVIIGMEISTAFGDVLIFGLGKELREFTPLEKIRKEVDEAGGVIILAHPFRGAFASRHARLEETLEETARRSYFSLVDAMETLNGGDTDEENNLAHRVARLIGKPEVGGSDAHRLRDVGRFCTRFDQEIHSEADLISAIKSGRYVPERL